MFVSTNDGYVNLAHVARIKTNWLEGDAARYVLYSADLKSLGFIEDQNFDIDALTAPIVPAAPGATVFLIYRPHSEARRPEADDVWAWEVPVLAWRCLPSGAFPVTLENEDLLKERILHPLPNGHFLAPGDRTFETVEQAVAETLRDAQERWDRRRGKQVQGEPA